VVVVVHTEALTVLVVPAVVAHLTLQQLLTLAVAVAVMLEMAVQVL
jgi:hypothetical protein